MGRKSKDSANHNEAAAIPAEPARYLCVWIDRDPDQPHLPPSGVMRWDLRPNDWWTQWPELLAHPCAYLFAPTHPTRDGPPRFADWIASWPKDFDWESFVPEQFHAKVREILPTLPTGPTTETVDAAGLVVRYAVPEHAISTMPTQPAGRESMLLQQLVQTLLGVSEEERENTARLLSTLALAPDSARTLEALKVSVYKSKQVA